MNVVFLNEAKIEIEDAVEYYELQSKGLGKVFKTELKQTVQRIVSFPLAWTEIKPDIRRAIMSKFPYNVLYSVEAESILILAVAHHHRKPNYWDIRVK